MFYFTTKTTKALIDTVLILSKPHRDTVKILDNAVIHGVITTDGLDSRVYKESMEAIRTYEWCVLYLTAEANSSICGTHAEKNIQS